MKITILVVIALMLYTVKADEIDYYDVPSLDMKKIAQNPLELANFMDCLLDRAPCKDVYKDYRALAPESIRQACRKCTRETKIFAYLFFLTLKTLLPEEYKNFRNKYDPENKYIDKLEEEVSKFKFEALAS